MKWVPLAAVVFIAVGVTVRGAELTEISSLSRSGARFYAAVTADVDLDGTEEIIVGGQIEGKGGRRGLVALYAREGRTLRLLKEDVFSVGHEKTVLPTRVRTVRARPGASRGVFEVYSCGLGGEDDSGVGFLRKAVLRGGRFGGAETFVFEAGGRDYAHGYPMGVADLDGDGVAEIIYGGFSGEGGVDRADVRILRHGGKGGLAESSLLPFETLPVPLRVNALAVGDVDADGKLDVVIAGRTISGGKERAAFAWWGGEEVSHHVLEERDASRFRCLLVEDLEGDGKDELVTGGRVDTGEASEALLQVWRFERGVPAIMSHHRWTGGGSTRLRGLTHLPHANLIIAVGRTEVREENGLSWKGFVREYALEEERLRPLGTPFIIDRGLETRLRDIAVADGRDLVLAGFSKGETGGAKAELIVLRSAPEPRHDPSGEIAH